MSWNRGVLAACGLAAVGCGGGVGGATVTGDIAGYSFEVRSAYAWLDATERETEGGLVVYKSRDQKTMSVVLAGAALDPEQDRRFLPLLERLELEQEIQLRGGATFSLSNFDRVAAGTTYASPDSDSRGDDPRLVSVSHALALTPLAADATFPSESVEFGSRTSYQVTLSELGRSPGESLSGTLVIRVERDDDDRQDARTGSITVEFDAKVIGEAIAECFANGNLRSCEPSRS